MPSRSVLRTVTRLLVHFRKVHGSSVEILWVTGHAGTLGNERADILAGKAADQYLTTSLAYLKLRISEKFKAWHKDPATLLDIASREQSRSKPLHFTTQRNRRSENLTTMAATVERWILFRKSIEIAKSAVY
jgi:hypothetical protein